jgi:hypothetical protein
VVVRKFVFVFVATAAEAQMALPMCKRPVSQEELVQAIRTNDQSILNTDCKKLVESTHRAFGPDFEAIKTCDDLAGWVSLLGVEEVHKMYEGSPATFARVMSDGSHDLYGFTRPIRRGERWLFDNQAGVYYTSLLCCNIVTRNELPVPYVPVVDVAAKMPRDRSLSRATRTTPPPAQQPQSYVEPEDVWRPIPRPWWSWNRKSGKLFWISAVAGGVLGAYCIVEECFSTTLTNTINVYK